MKKLITIAALGMSLSSFTANANVSGSYRCDYHAGLAQYIIGWTFNGHTSTLAADIEISDTNSVNAELLNISNEKEYPTFRFESCGLNFDRTTVTCVEDHKSTEFVLASCQKK